MNIQRWKNQFKFVGYDDSFTVCFSRLIGNFGSVIKAGCNVLGNMGSNPAGC